MSCVDRYSVDAVTLELIYLIYTIIFDSSISGSGTVVTGRVEQGVVKTGDDLEVVGIVATQKTICTGSDDDDDIDDCRGDDDDDDDDENHDDDDGV